MHASQPVPPLPCFDPSWALFLDVDGTLIEFARRPDEIEPRPELIETLGTLQRTFPLALISGRRISDLDRLFAPLKLPAAGQHGAERRSADGQIYLAPVPKDALISARTALVAWMRERPGIVLEDKGLCMAVHYRGAPEREREASEVLEETARLLGGMYVVRLGKMVAELRPSGHDKGSAIEAFMGEAPFLGRVPIFAGDDATDEEGFEAVNRLEGHSIKVGEGPTAARWRLANVGQVLDWLSRFARSAAAAPPGG
jgi:trehalose 6-phosphate phosphatase